MKTWSLDDFAIVLVLDKGAAGELLSGLMGKAQDDFTAEPPFEPSGGGGIQNVPPASGAQDELDALGVKDPGIKATKDAKQLIARTKYYDAVKKQKAQGN